METRQVLRYRSGIFESSRDDVITEMRISVCVNRIEVAGLMALPESINHLAIGFLYGIGLVSAPAEISGISVDASSGSVNVTGGTERIATWLRNRSSLTIGSSRGLMQVPEGSSIDPAGLQTNTRHSVRSLLGAINELCTSSSLFRQTGAVHSCGLWQSGKFLFCHDDIGRHNAVDKVIGHALTECWPIPDDAVIISTGRISSDVVAKTLRARIPVLVSHSAPTGVAVRLAEAHGLTLIGFARETRCNIYTHPQRIIP